MYLQRLLTQGAADGQLCALGDRLAGPSRDDAGDEAPSEEEFEEDLEEEVVDRDALKKQSGTILDKATKKTKKRRGKKAA